MRCARGGEQRSVPVCEVRWRQKAAILVGNAQRFLKNGDRFLKNADRFRTSLYVFGGKM